MRDSAAPHAAAGDPRLRLLGVPELQARRAQRFPPERRFRLLAYLALGGKWASRDELAALFWPDRPQKPARSNLRKLVLEVRALDLPLLQADPHGLRWAVATDVAELRNALSRGDLATVLALYRGPFAQGLDGGDSEPFTRWLNAEREHLHAQWRDAVLQVLPQRTPAAALELAQRLLADDPLDEEALRAALRALTALDRSADALRLYREFAGRVADELGVEVSNETRALARALQGSGVVPASTPTPTTDDSSFVGRAKDLSELIALLAQPDCRLLTVTGPGGIGKSRLVKQAIKLLAPQFPDGLWWIALDDLPDTALVAPRIATELGVELAPNQDAVHKIGERLRDKRALLVLDNSEHLPRLAEVVAQLLSDATQIKVLSTSRARFGIAGEWLMPLAGLALPPAGATAADALNCDAVRLFDVTARAARPNFDLAANAQHVVALVRAVAGMPLAILIAAGWLRLMSPEDLLAEVESSLDVLESAEAGEERPEHRGVRATFERSWQMLVPAEKHALSFLSAFAGGFTRAGAKDVADASLPVLASLVDKSLVQAQDDGRFSLHPLIRQFAAEMLAAEGNALQAARARHAAVFGRWLAREHEHTHGPDQARLLAALQVELPDCLAAWRHACTTSDAEFIAAAAVPLQFFFQSRGRHVEGVQILRAAQAAMNADEPKYGPALAQVGRGLSTLLYRQGEFAQTEAEAGTGLTLARRHGMRAAQKACLLNLGLALWQRGEWSAAREQLEQALRLARADDDRYGMGVFLCALAILEHEQDDSVAAERDYRESLRIARELGETRSAITVLNNLGQLLTRLGRYAEALPLLEEGLRLSESTGVEGMRAHFLFNIGTARFGDGNLAAARAYTQQALTAAQSCERMLLPEVHAQLARLDLQDGRIDTALTCAREALRLARDMDDPPLALICIGVTAEVIAAAGDAARAATLFAFVATHPLTPGVERSAMHTGMASLVLDADAMSAAQAIAGRYELGLLATELLAPMPHGVGARTAQA